MEVAMCAWVLRPSLVVAVLPFQSVVSGTSRSKPWVVVSSLIFGEVESGVYGEMSVWEGNGCNANEPPSEWNLACFFPRSDCQQPTRGLLSTHVQHEQIKQSSRWKVAGYAFILEKICSSTYFWWIIL